MTLNSYDFFDIYKDLTAEQRLVQETTRKFVKEEFQPLIEDAFERGIFPSHLPQRLGELGLLGSTIQGYGCA